MAAGAGYIEFTTGDILTASAANEYLASQVVMVFASASARTSAIASPQEGMMSYLKDTNSVEYYSGSAWVAVGASSGSGLTLINSTTFSGSTAVNVDNVFSSTYRNYRIVASFVESSASDYSLRVRSGGTSYTTAKYEGRGWTNGGSLTGVTYNSSTAWIIGSQGTSAAGFSLDIYAPNITGYLTFTSTAVGLSSGSAATGSSVNGWIDATTVADGFQIFPASGTITGKVEVYGYAD